MCVCCERAKYNTIEIIKKEENKKRRRIERAIDFIELIINGAPDVHYRKS